MDLFSEKLHPQGEIRGAGPDKQFTVQRSPRHYVPALIVLLSILLPIPRYSNMLDTIHSNTTHRPSPLKPSPPRMGLALCHSHIPLRAIPKSRAHWPPATIVQMASRGLLCSDWAGKSWSLRGQLATTAGASLPPQLTFRRCPDWIRAKHT